MCLRLLSLRIIASSANCKHKTSDVVFEYATQWMSLFLAANSRIWCSESVMRTNRSGEMGSPCRRSCLELIHLVGASFMRRAILLEDRMFSIHLHHLSPNFLALKIARIYDQLMLSKAFSKSSLSARPWVFDLELTAIISATLKKQTFIYLPLMNAD